MQYRISCWLYKSGGREFNAQPRHTLILVSDRVPYVHLSPTSDLRWEVVSYMQRGVSTGSEKQEN
jgi:hypothetical protein